MSIKIFEGINLYIIHYSYYKESLNNDIGGLLRLIGNEWIHEATYNDRINEA